MAITELTEKSKIEFGPEFELTERRFLDPRKFKDPHVTAEGVEDRETLLDLRRLSCHCAQEYHLVFPVPALDIPESVAALNAELSNNAEVP